MKEFMMVVGIAVAAWQVGCIAAWAVWQFKYDGLFLNMPAWVQDLFEKAGWADWF